MKLENLYPKFSEHPYLTTLISTPYLYNLPFKDFDKDGYEVPNYIERRYYEAEGIDLNCEIQYHVAPVQAWYTDQEDSEHGLVLDHCMLLTRYAFAGLARSQIESVVKDRPILQKLLNIKPKWGLDFSLDYITKDVCMEVIHIEQNFDNLEEANKARMKLENIIDNTDWEQGAQDLIKCKSEWEHLSSDDHSDYKAQFFGWHRAFDNKKVF